MIDLQLITPKVDGMKADAKVVQHDLECQQECANPWLLVNSCNCRNHLADLELRPQEGPMEPQ